jgi:hypothetical protein
MRHLSATERSPHRAQKRPGLAGQHITERCAPLAARLMADHIRLAELSRLDHDNQTSAERLSLSDAGDV